MSVHLSMCEYQGNAKTEQENRTGSILHAKFKTSRDTYNPPPPPQHIPLHIDNSPVELKIDKTADENERK